MTKWFKRAACGVIVVIMAIMFVVVILGGGGNRDDDCVPGAGARNSGGGAVEDGRVPEGSFALPQHDSLGHVTSGFGMRWGAMHEGVDIAQGQGAPIFAFADGVVSISQTATGYGWMIVIDHEEDGTKFATLYGHMFPEDVLVQAGDAVYAGQQIAREGWNGGVKPPGPGGSHLHFEVHVPGYRNPVEPMPWLEKAVEPGSGDTRSRGRSDESSTKSEEPASDPSSPWSPPAPDTAGMDSGSIRDLRASQIIAIGRQRGEDDFTIQAALQAAIVESDLHNSASEAVPESKNYPHDSVVPGDHDSVGLFQQRVSIWLEVAGSMEKLMDPVQQINWFYDKAKKASADTPGELAAIVENPRAEYRHRYGEREEDAKEVFRKLEGVDPDSIDIGGVDNCDNPSDKDRRAPGAELPATDVGERILAAAREQFGLPYVWGGGDFNGPTSGEGGGAVGFDCSGLVLYAVYQATNGEVALPHFTGSQEADPQLVTVPLEEMAPGDLIYTPGHVAIYSGEKDGQRMMYEAQNFGVPIGEYPIRDEEIATIKRVAPREQKPDQENKDEVR